MTRIKICGMMRPQDVILSSNADLIGFVVGAGTKRSLTVEIAKQLMDGADRECVVVTTYNDTERIIELTGALDPDIIQIASPISPDELNLISKAVDCDIWATIAVGSGKELERLFDISHLVDAIVLDTCCIAGGGSGKVHDWDISAELRDLAHSHPIVLAGGLNASNVSEAIRKVRPSIVDVSSGVEKNGMKDGDMISEMITIVRSVKS